MAEMYDVCGLAAAQATRCACSASPAPPGAPNAAAPARSAARAPPAAGSSGSQKATYLASVEASAGTGSVGRDAW